MLIEGFRRGLASLSAATGVREGVGNDKSRRQQTSADGIRPRYHFEPPVGMQQGSSGLFVRCVGTGADGAQLRCHPQCSLPVRHCQPRLNLNM